jgi:hypothetical protein
MSTISASTTSTTAYKVTADTTGALVLQTGATPTTALTIDASQNATFAGTVADSTGTLRPLVSGTAVASTSGTSIDFTSIPSWVKRITVMFNGVSISTSQFLIQLGTSGGVTATGYNGGSTRFASTTLASATNTTGAYYVNNTATTYSGATVFTNITGNSWTWMGQLGTPSAAEFTVITSGGVTLGSALTSVRITIVGVATFTAGTINIMYEG